RDDVIYVKRRPDGGYKLFVATPDIAHYIPLDSPLDAAVHKSATSYYYPGTNFPMFPRHLEKEVFSLDQGKKRLAIVYEMDLSGKGELQDLKITEGVIINRWQTNYDHFEHLRTSKSEKFKPYQVYHDLFKILQKQRDAKGSFALERPEAKFELNKDGTVRNVYQEVRNDAHKLIEEFMVITNVAVPEFLFKKWEAPAGNRNHREAEDEAVRELYDFAQKKLRLETEEYSDPLVTIQSLIKSADEAGKLNLLMEKFWQTLPAATYSEGGKGHFALAAMYYAQMTSPIRRLMDLWNQRITKFILDNEHQEVIDFSQFDKRLMLAADRATHMSMMAKKAEWDVLDLKYLSIFDTKNTKKTSVLIVGVSSRGVALEFEGMTYNQFLGSEYLKKLGYKYDAKSDKWEGYKGQDLILDTNIDVNIKRIDYIKRQLDLEF
ncbi:RNB domain-containing ribonuclease, partial [bacterium]|nr:RNB domain-containing ribonuclease [bacterium]